MGAPASSGTDVNATGASAPSVVFGSGPRPEASTHVTVAAFEGPLGLLLALIEARELDIMTVPLGALADAYLDALASLAGERIGNVAAFVAVASQLILIKSQALLPRPPAAATPLADDAEGDPEEELRARLIAYRAIRDAALRLQARADSGRLLFHRDASLAAAAGRAGARPEPTVPLDPATLVTALDALARLAPEPEEPAGIVARTVTLADRAAVIRAALRGQESVILQELLRGVRDRVVVAVTFLALLELSKRRELTVEQAEPWGPIVARRTAGFDGDGDGDGDSGPGPAIQPIAGDGFDESLGGFA